MAYRVPRGNEPDASASSSGRFPAARRIRANLEIVPLWRFYLVRGAVALVAGLLLLVWPDRTLLLIGVILGVYLLVHGVLGVIRALTAPGLLAMERAIPATLGLLAVAAGVVVVVRPSSSVLAVALAAGIYLIVAGLAATVEAIRDPAIGLPRACLELINVAAGVVVVAWPDVSVTVVAVVLGIALAVRGIAEVFLGLWLARSRDGAAEAGERSA